MARPKKDNLNTPAGQEFLRPLVTGWLAKIALAKTHKQPFNDIADQCMQFFCGPVGFMWDQKYLSRFMGKGGLTPKFKITIAKAFELVAVFGPSLYWNNPQRSVRPHRKLDLPQELFAAIQDPQLQQMWQQEQESESPINAARCALMQHYLNYTPRVQPADGLAFASEMAITEALVKGRGPLWTEPFELPGSTRVLTGSFWDTVDNQFIDPDCKDPSMDDAKWIVRRCIKPVYEVEREYQLPKDSLKGKGNIESGEAQGAVSEYQRKRGGKSYDLIEYYKIYSKGGTGARMTGMGDALRDELEETVGDYAYLVVASGVDYPLNAPTAKFETATSDEVRRMFAWPIEYWRQGKWPVQNLDFYRRPGYQWPLAPLGAGLGELTFINTMMSHLCGRIHTSSRDFIGVLKSAAKSLKPQILSGEDLTVVEIEDSAKSIQDCISVLQMPTVNKDVWEIIDRVLVLFERRTGLSEILYGANSGGVASRSAEDAKAKQQNAGIRPEYMAGKVEDWQAHIAQAEKYCASRFVQAQDIEPLMGKVGATLWDRLITQEDPEVILHQMDATVEAGSAKKPDKARDADNVHAMLPVLTPLFQQYAMGSRDTRPINALIQQWGDAIDQDVSGMMLGEWVPEQDPGQQQQQQHEQEMAQQEAQQTQQQHEQEMQAQQVQTQSEMQQSQMDLQLKQMEMELKRQEIQLDAQSKQMELGFKQQEGQMKLAQGQQQLHLAAQQGRQQLDLSAQQSKQQLDNSKQMGEAKVTAAKKMAAAKPKPTSKPKAASKA